MSNKKTTKQKVAVLGAGNMGTAIAMVLADNGHTVHIWNWEGDIKPLQDIEKYSENKKYLRGHTLSKRIIAKYNIMEALEGVTQVYLVIPSHVLEHTIAFAAKYIPDNAVIIDVSKGLDPNTLRITPHIIQKHVRPKLKKNVVAISGPAIAAQMAERKFTAMNIAGKHNVVIKKVQAVMENDYTRLVPSNDVMGIQIGGAFKNVYTIAIGMCDGLEFGLNTKAALLTYALDEIQHMIVAMGGNKSTAYELAGIGDLIGTSLSPHSRNRTFGHYLGDGLTTPEALKKITQVVEGIDATYALMRLAREHHIHAPFAHMVHQCITSKTDPRPAFIRFLQQLGT